MFSITKVLQMLFKELNQLMRDPKMKALVFGPPLLQLIIFGYAVNLDVKNVRTAIVDYDRTPASREFTSLIRSNGYFIVNENPDNAEKVVPMIDSGAVVCAVVVEKGFMKNIESGQTARVQVIHDGTDSNTSTMVINYLNVISGKYSRGLQKDKLNRMNAKRAAAGAPAIRIGAINVEPRAWFNENLESKNYFVPGIIGNIIMLVTLMLTAMAVVREKEIGTIEQLMVTPIRPVEIILGKTIPFMIIAIFQSIMIMCVAIFWFDIPMLGSVPLLFAGILIFIISCLGLGIFISTISTTQQQAMLVTTFFFLPAMTLSGFMFPIVNMPEAVQYITYLIPLRYFLVIVRGIFLKGVGLNVLYPQFIALFILSTVIFSLSVMRFRKTID